MKKQNIYFIFGVLLCLFATTLFSNETLIKITDNDDINYIKPEVKIHPNGAIYIVYQADNVGAGRSDIHLSKYQDGKVSFERNLSNSSGHSYEPEIDIRSNGDIHVTWCDHIGDNHYIKYAFYDGTNWSGVWTLGHVGGSEIEDLRIAVDDNGNVFIVFMYWPAAKCILISKYGDSVSFEGFPASGRSKHPDVDVDSDYVHIAWQYREGGGDYTIAYQKRPNTPGSRWENLIDLKVYGPFGVQRPRMTLDSDNYPHINFFSKGSDSIRRMDYKYWNGSKFTGLLTLSAPNEYATYHFCDIYAANSNNMIVTMQKGGWGGGSGVHYNWRINGTWSGYSLFSKSVGLRPAKQSVDLDHNSLRAALAFAQRDDAIYLIIKTGSGAVEPNAPVALFTVDPQSGPVPLSCEFDASASYALDGATITEYNWNFGDGSGATGQTTSHTFTKKGSFIVTLTVKDSNGKSGTNMRTVEVLNNPPFAFFLNTPKSGLFPLTVTFDPARSEDLDGTIVKYFWDFGDGYENSETKTTNEPFTHVYNDIGTYIATLTVYDDDNASSTYSQSIQVYGVEAPVNIKAEIMENRTLFTIKYVTKLTWDNNQLNKDRGVNIVKYKIYRKRKNETDYTFIAEHMATGDELYNDRIGKDRIEYDYKIVAYEEGGKSSDD